MFFQLASTNVPQVFGRYARRCSRRPRTDHPQNTEDEVLKAAIAKYGKNQWCVSLRLCLAMSTYH